MHKKWVAIANFKAVATGKNHNEVYGEALKNPSALAPYMVQVGKLRISKRRTPFKHRKRSMPEYDTSDLK